jgi:pyruvate-ferredoxin/flavodoxin oxidoreductase
VASGYWPLLPVRSDDARRGMNPFRLDSPRPRIPLEEYRYNEVRFKAIGANASGPRETMLDRSQRGILERYQVYEIWRRETAAGSHPA